MSSTVRGQIDLWPFKVALSQRSPRTCDVTRDPSSNRQVYQCNDCNGRFTTLQRVYVTTCGHVGPVELWIIKVVKPTMDPTGATYDDASVVWGHSPVDIDTHKLSSWKVVHQCVLTCSHWWTIFQLLRLWLSMSMGLWPQTTHASS